MRCAPSGNHRESYDCVAVFFSCYCLFSSIIFSIFTFPNAQTLGVHSAHSIRRIRWYSKEGNSLRGSPPQSSQVHSLCVPDYSRAYSTSTSSRGLTWDPQAFSEEFSAFKMPFWWQRCILLTVTFERFSWSHSWGCTGKLSQMQRYSY